MQLHPSCQRWWSTRGFVLASSGPVDCSRRPVRERLVRTLLIVEREVPPQTRAQLRRPFVAVQVDVLVFHTPPQPFHEHVVQTPTATIPAHRSSGRLHTAGPRLRRKLHPLVGVEHLGPAATQCLLQQVQAERTVQRVRQPPADELVQTRNRPFPNELRGE